MTRLVTACGLFLAAAACAADWSQFRGPGGTAADPKADPPTEWGPDKNVKWTAALPGPGSSSPVVLGDRVYVTCYSGYGAGKGEPGDVGKLVRHLVCADRATGKVLWTGDVPGHTPEDTYRGFITEHGYASSTPAADADAVYCFFGKSGVVAFDPAGKKLWQTSVGTDSDPMRWGSSPSVLLHKDLVVVNAAAESRSVRALDRRTGKEVWKAEGRKLGASYSTPALVKAEAGRTDLVVAMPGEVWGLDPDTGKTLWTAAVRPNGNVSPSVVPGDGAAYVTGGFGVSGTTAVKVGGTGDVTKTHVLWEVRQSSYVPTPLLHDGRLHYVTDGGGAVCLDAATGKPVYEEKLGLKGGGISKPVYASPVLAGGRLYAPSRTAGVFVLDAGKEFKLVAKNPPLDPTDFNGTPAVVGKQLFLRSNKALYCVE